MATIPTDIPSELRAGDRWQWTKALADYDSDSYTLSYYLTAPTLTDDKNRYDGTITDRGTTTITITASADGDGDFEVDYSATDSEDLRPGKYTYLARVDDGSGDVKTVDSGTVRVLENIATRTADYDERTKAQLIVEKCDAAIAAMVDGKPVQSYAIGNRNLSRMSLQDLRDTRRQYQAIAHGERVAQGGLFIKTVKARFV